MHDADNINPTLARIAPLLVIAAGICWGCVGLFVRPLEAAGFTSFEIVCIRSSLAAIFFVAVNLVRNPHVLRIRPRDLWCFLGTGCVGFMGVSVFYYITISMTTLSVAAVLMYTAPAFVLVFSRLLFGETITLRKLVAVVLTITGCVFVSGMLTETPQITPLGLLIGIASGISYASYSIFSRFALERGYEPATVTSWTFLLGALASMLLCNPAEIAVNFTGNPTAIPAALGLALINAIAAYLLYTTGLQYMENGRASVVVSIEPVVATLVGVFVFGELFTWQNGVGVALVFAAVTLLGLGKNSGSNAR